MQAKKIKLIKNCFESLSVSDIQVFLGFIYLSWQFIKSFSKIVAPLKLILKTTWLPNKPFHSRNNSSRPVFKQNNCDSEINGFGDSGIEHGKSKASKLAKSKKQSKSRNSPNFGAKKAWPSFLTSGPKTVCNCLRLAFTDVLIL